MIITYVLALLLTMQPYPAIALLGEFKTAEDCRDVRHNVFDVRPDLHREPSRVDPSRMWSDRRPDVAKALPAIPMPRPDTVV